MKGVRQDGAMVAMQGGRPVRTTLLPYGHHVITEEDVQAVVEVLRSEWITTGPKVAEFEEAFAAYVGAKYAVSFSSGTAALHGAAFAAGLGPGDEAITSPLTFCATANSLLYQGARPIFADVCPDTLTLDVDEAARRITPRTKVLLPIDYAGHPADLDACNTLAQQHGLIVIEDACHALGARYRGKRVGSISDLSVFSFHPVKHITAGEGGMVTTDRPAFADRLRLFRSHGIHRDPERANDHPWHYEMVELGYNYRLSDIAAALGHSQLARVEANLARRRVISQRYLEALRGLPGLMLPTVEPHVECAWHLFPVRVAARRDEVVRALHAEHIGVQVHYLPVHLHSFYRRQFGYRGGEYPVAERAAEQLVSLPMFHGMRDHDIEDVIRALDKVLTHLSIPRPVAAGEGIRQPS